MIRMENVDKAFGDFMALSNLSINIKKGSIYGLVGINGSGKTTIIKLATGVWRPDCGEILVDGQPVYENEAVKKRIGYIPDDLYFFATYNLKESARFYRSVYPEWDQDRYRQMVEQFGLQERQKLSRFSKGMQKQAAFLLTMCCRPEHLVLDEPIDGLDPIVRKLVWKYVVQDVAERGMTVLVSSHNLREMEGICDSIGILSHGHMRLERELDELKADIHKVQVAYRQRPEQPLYEELNVKHRETRGSVDLLIVREPRERVERIIGQYEPVIFDLLPLSLEEIFIYELGGEDYDVKDILV
ncbi:MAG: ABC transporter ATP-binding protein [Bacillota bacterium]|nr:ABC transporter ATP-binding protein [Bacillota bacterium]